MNAMGPIPDPADLLARAEKALRDAPAPEGPSADVVARTRAALHGAEQRPDHTLKHRRNSMIAILRFAALASVASVAAGLSYLATTPRAEATTAFAEAARRLQVARTLSYEFSVQVPEQDRPTVGREFYKDPGLIRTEGDPPRASVVITDLARGKILSLEPESKLAILQDWKLDDDLKRRSQGRASDGVKFLRSLAGKDGKPVGKRRIGGVEAEGFRVEEGGMSWTIWVDPERKFPLLMETTIRLQGRDLAATMSGFRIDPELDDALFRLDPPDGYALRKVDVPIAIREEALVNLLRLYADAPGGAFPPRPDDAAAFQKRFPKEDWKGPDDPRMIRLSQSLAASVVFLQFELKNAYGYRPAGVKLGDADKILFWYRPKDSKNYRAIFGDLHAEDVAADRLPEKPAF